MLTRNSCCHHARLWNRSLSLRALVMTRPLRPWVGDDVRQGRVFFTLCILKHFVDIIRPNNHFKQQLIALLSQYPMVDTSAMGFVKDWQRQPLWKVWLLKNIYRIWFTHIFMLVTLTRHSKLGVKPFMLKKIVQTKAVNLGWYWVLGCHFVTFRISIRLWKTAFSSLS